MLEVNRRVYLEDGTVRQESVRDIGKIIKYIANEFKGYRYILKFLYSIAFNKTILSNLYIKYFNILS